MTVILGCFSFSKCAYDQPIVHSKPNMLWSLRRKGLIDWFNQEALIERLLTPSTRSYEPVLMRMKRCSATLGFSLRRGEGVGYLAWWLTAVGYCNELCV